jgi:hypothetical protein
MSDKESRELAENRGLLRIVDRSGPVKSKLKFIAPLVVLLLLGGV